MPPCFKQRCQSSGQSDVHSYAVTSVYGWSIQLVHLTNLLCLRSLMLLLHKAIYWPAATAHLYVGYVVLALTASHTQSLTRWCQVKFLRVQGSRSLELGQCLFESCSISMACRGYSCIHPALSQVPMGSFEGFHMSEQPHLTRIKLAIPSAAFESASSLSTKSTNKRPSPSQKPGV